MRLRIAMICSAVNDPDMTHAASQSPLVDLKTLASGFRDLSANAAEMKRVIGKT